MPIYLDGVILNRGGPDGKTDMRMDRDVLPQYNGLCSATHSDGRWADSTATHVRTVMRCWWWAVVIGGLVVGGGWCEDRSPKTKVGKEGNGEMNPRCSPVSLARSRWHHDLQPRAATAASHHQCRPDHSLALPCRRRRSRAVLAPPPLFSLSLPPSLPHCLPAIPLPPSLPPSLAPSLPRSLPPSLTHSLSPAHSLLPTANKVPCMHSHALPHSLTNSLTHPTANTASCRRCRTSIQPC